MKFSSPLIYNLARASPSPSVDPSDAELDVPALLVPVITIPREFPRLAGFVDTTPQRQSFMASDSAARAASEPAATVTLATFGRGLWGVELNASLLADFSQVPASAFNNRVELVDPAGTAVILLGLYQQTNVPQYRKGRYVFLFTEDSWRIDIVVAATGVGQTIIVNSSIVATLFH